MSGHFLLTNIPQSELNMASSKGAVWSPIAHQHVGWSDTSKAALGNVLNGVAIPNRNNLPPHCYLQFAGSNPAAIDLRNYLKAASWVDNLTRPAGGGFGLTGLCPVANGLFLGGHKADALVAQIEHGGVSVEIYYVSGYPI